MAYLDSDKIKVYPSGYRVNVDEASFVNSEENLNSLADRLASNKSYISYEDGSNIKFVIKGYLFSASKSYITSLASATENTIIYASCTVIPAVSSNYNTLVPYGSSSTGPLDEIQSSVSKFVGVNFTVDSGDLALYKYENSQWKVVEESKLIFTTEQIKNTTTNQKSIKEEFTTKKIIVTGSSTDVILPDKSINTDEIDDNAITEDKIADNAITTNKIFDASITSAKIDRGEVKTVNLDTGAVTTTKIDTGAVTKAKLDTSVFDALYPVGSIYMSTTRIEATASTEDKWGCPLASLWTSSKWEKLEGRFLLGAGTSTDADYESNTYTAGDKSGYADAHIVSHNHIILGGNTPLTLTTSSDTHSHAVGTPEKDIYGTSFTRAGGSGNYDLTLSTTQSSANLSTMSNTHTHTVTINPWDVTNYKTGDVGSSGAGKNMPPYLVVYMWKRKE